MQYDIQHICDIVNGTFLNQEIRATVIKQLVYDTRKILLTDQVVFVALQGEYDDGHAYITEAYHKGIRNYLVSEEVDYTLFPTANFIKVVDTLRAIQQWAAAYRKNLSFPLIAITGSNGKTIIKEWLALALQRKQKVGKSPMSYNSQLGVALSLLQLDEDNDIGIIEAGISKVHEMTKLEKMIQPEVGIFSNIGDAHQLGFDSKKQKITEKLKLFRQVQLLIYNSDMAELREVITQQQINTLTWGMSEHADVLVTEQDDQHILCQYSEASYKLKLPFGNSQLIENCMHIITYLISTGWTEAEINAALRDFSSLPNRLEIKRGIRNSILIDDSYSSDVTSLQSAFETLDQHAHSKKRIAIISAFDERSVDLDSYSQLSELIQAHNIEVLITIGMSADALTLPELLTWYKYHDLDTYLQAIDEELYDTAVVLIKGARRYNLDRLSMRLTQQAHMTRLETNLTAIAHNLGVFRSHLDTGTKLMIVVKADAYGSGSSELVKFLEGQKVDYLAVALVDEAIKVRQAGCELPIMVFNVQEHDLELLWRFRIEPEVYSLTFLKKLIAIAETQTTTLAIHLKLESGMHRLGFMPEELMELAALLNDTKQLRVTSVFSHLASSGNPDNDEMTASQFHAFDIFYNKLIDLIADQPIRHILNSSGIIRFPDRQYEMVRLGLGMYGIDDTGIMQGQLIKVHSLIAQVIQVKAVKRSAGIGYEGAGRLEEDGYIAVVSIGYADGLMRRAGSGKYSLMRSGVNYPIMGNVCMDVTMIHLGTEATLKEGDELIIFGPNHPVEALAACCETISYEILSRIAPRVKRSYIYE